MFFNISLFDSPDVPAAPGQGDADDVAAPDIARIASICGPTVLCLIMILILIKQNLDRIVALIGAINQCVDRFKGFFDQFIEFFRGRTVVAVADPPCATVLRPRNLTDSEIIEMRDTRPGERWI